MTTTYCATCGVENPQEAHRCDARRLVAEYPQLRALIDEARAQAFSAAIREVEKESRWQIELMIRDPEEKWGHSVNRLKVVADCLRHIATRTPKTTGI